MFPELNTKRLLLQQIKPEDQQFIFEGLSHPDVIPFYGVRYGSFEATKVQMNWYYKMFEEGSGISWKIVEKLTNKKLGVISIYFYKPEYNKAEIGFWLLPQFWHKGFATEALREAVSYWKTEKKLHRLEGFVEQGNRASIRFLEKAGFAHEGTMRDCEIKNGKYISLLIYALILE
ncbi:MAG: GNAT family N-acetyltransferase [Chitinophagaceae bacterium]